MPRRRTSEGGLRQRIACDYNNQAVVKRVAKGARHTPPAGTRGGPGTRLGMLSRESHLLGHLALKGTGDRGPKGAPEGVALGLWQFAEHAPKPSLGFGAPPPVGV